MPAFRVLVIVAHPDDEAFFMGGTIARYARQGEVRLVVVTDGGLGKEAVHGADGRVAAVVPPADETARRRLVARRQRETLESARWLGIADVEFLGWPEPIGTAPQLLLCAFRRRIRHLAPDIVLSLNEAGTTAHADHSWVALLAGRAVVEAARRDPARPRHYFTSTSPEVVGRFDRWGELGLPAPALVEIDVADLVEQRVQACRAHRSQAHWVEYLERVELLRRPVERLALRWARDGTQQVVPMPLPAPQYTASAATLGREIAGRALAVQADRLRAVVLASGAGTRMGNPALPKSLEPVGGVPMLLHILHALAQADVDESPVVVIGAGGALIRAAIGDGEFAEQDQPRGTAHALACARAVLVADEAAHVVVVYGDMPLVSAAGLREVVRRHLAGGATLTLTGVRLPDFDGPHAHFRHHGRIVRDGSGRVRAVIEHADATPEVAAVTEVNAGVYCFRTAWLWGALQNVRADNVRGELYLTSAVAAAIAAGEPVVTVEWPCEDALGVNTREQLQAAEEILQQRLSAPPPSGSRTHTPHHAA